MGDWKFIWSNIRLQQGLLCTKNHFAIQLTFEYFLFDLIWYFEVHSLTFRAKSFSISKLKSIFCWIELEHNDEFVTIRNGFVLNWNLSNEEYCLLGINQKITQFCRINIHSVLGRKKFELKNLINFLFWK